ncbi:hypothetical protein SOI901_16 [Erwinia phage SOI901]
MRNPGRGYSSEDKYRHHLGILRSIMRRLGMKETAPLSDIPNELNKQLDILGETLEIAVDYGVAFIQIKADGSRRILKPQEVMLVHVPESKDE